MMRFLSRLAGLLVGSLLVLLSACADEVTLPTLDEVVATTPTLTALAGLIGGTDIEARLADESATYTLFAPSNLALGEASNDEAVVANLLRDHLVVGRVGSSQSTVTTLLGRDLSLAQGSGTTLILAGDIRLEDPIDVANGTLYILDTTINTPTLTDLVAADGRFSTLLSIAAQSDLATVLDGDEPLTLFAPTDAAFGSLGDLPSDAALADIVRYHLVSEQILFADLPSRDTLDTLQGGPITVASDGTTVVLNGNDEVALTLADQRRGLNGVLYVLDVVLDAPESTLADRVARSADLTTFANALDMAGLSELLTDEGPRTIFAPTDAAFAALPSEVRDALFADPAALAALLRYHVVADTALASGVLLGEGRGTLSSAATARHAEVGLTLTYNTVTSTPAQLQLNGQATLSATDLSATNGVLHKLDAVLTPLSVLELLTLLPDSDELVAGFNRLDAAFAGLEPLALLNDEVATAQPLTLFAPRDAALGDLPDDDTALLATLGFPLLSTQSLTLADLAADAPEALTTFATEQGLAGTLTTTMSGGRLGLFGANAVLVGAGDFVAVNGLIHRISGGLEPTPLPGE